MNGVWTAAEIDDIERAFAPRRCAGMTKPKPDRRGDDIEFVHKACQRPFIIVTNRMVDRLGLPLAAYLGLLHSEARSRSGYEISAGFPAIEDDGTFGVEASHLAAVLGLGTARVAQYDQWLVKHLFACIERERGSDEKTVRLNQRVFKHRLGAPTDGPHVRLPHALTRVMGVGRGATLAVMLDRRQWLAGRKRLDPDDSFAMRQSTIADRLRLSLNTVGKYQREMAEMGILTIRRDRTPPARNRIRINAAELAKLIGRNDSEI